MGKVIGALAIMASLLQAPAFAAQAPVFVFTAIPDQDETRLNERFSKVADYLHEKLGIAVKYVPVKSYPAAVTAFVNGQVQLAWFGGVTGVQARARVPGSMAIAQGAEDDHFKSYLIANASTGLKPAADIPTSIAGKTLAFGARTSTSGSVMPEYYLRKAFGDRAPDKVFSRVGFTGDHSQTIQAVQSGAYQLGFVDYSVWDLDRKAGKVDDKKVSVIWETPPFPDYQWTVRGDADATFGAGFTTKLTQTLLAITDKDILGRFGRSKFIPATNAQYAPVEAVAKAAGLLE
ncbi:MAG: putative selenate ABC transporter substrate-binding protein [Hyphomicrobiales bacterium]|nr:putative selenate ABC transporter substrate-binding protein [Hyphomicrobiales bacterium]MDE2114872.1 putative selenate ABC transporter substrate-binding protein [Hyphomicrobiales bacterium]